MTGKAKLVHLGRRAPLAAILVLYTALACTYSLVTPFFEKTDEVYHVAYVKHLADGKGFPPFDRDNPARLAATHPPLYYLIGALLIAPIDTDDLDSLTRLNPYYRPVWDGVVGDNRNRYVHVVDEATPAGGTALAVRLLRSLSIVLGGVTVVATHAIARTLFPDHRWLAAGATAFCAFNPQYLYASGTVNNDVLIAATCALTGLAAARIVRAPQPRARHAAVAGLALGTALLSKVSAVVVVPVVVLAVGYGAYKASRAGARRSISLGVQWVSIALLCALAVSGWWFTRNAILLDGDLTGAAEHVEKWGRRRRALTLDALRLETQGLEESYWAVFGLNSIPIDRWVNLILFTVNRLTFAGGIVLAIKQWTRWRYDPETRFGTMLMGLWVAGSLASVLYWMYLMKGMNLGRLLYPALSPLALLMVLCLSQFVPQRWRPAATAVLSLALCALAIACPFVYILPNYAPPPILDEAQVGPLSERLDANYQGQIKLLGYHVPREETWPGDTLPITLYYQAMVPFGIDYTVFVHFVDAQGNIVVQQDTYPGMGRYPTTLWQPGQIIADTFYLTLPEWTPAPGTGILEAGFYDRDTGLRLLVVDENGQAVADSVWFHSMPTIPPPEGG
jgi:4-amino-4-deoxy-L-arabinose transferase-like glycosyltransferase